MRIVSLLCFAIFMHCVCLAQKINYTIPAGYEADINAADYKRLVDLALPEITKRYKVAGVTDGAITLQPGQDLQVLNLHNLIGKCVDVEDRTRWQAVVAEHFSNLFTSLEVQRSLDPANYDSVRQYLSLRIYPLATITQRGGAAGYVSRTDLEGTLTMLMLDLPGAFTPVNKEAFMAWKKDSSQVFAAAQANVNRKEMEKLTQQFDVGSSKITISFLGNDDYAASYALDLLRNAPELVGEWGSVVAIPNKGLVNICKIDRATPLDFVNFIQYAKQSIEDAYRDHDQPVSDKFFWYYKNRFKLILVTTGADGSVNVLSPMGLSELMTQEK